VATRKETATVDIKVRMKEPLRRAIEQAARRTNISLNAEAVRRLESSFDRADLLPEVVTLTYGRQMAGLLLAIGEATAWASRFTAFMRNDKIDTSNWLDDPAAFKQAEDAIRVILDALRPPGQVPTLGDPSLDNLGANQAAEILSRARGDAAPSVIGDQIAELIGKDALDRIDTKAPPFVTWRSRSRSIKDKAKTEKPQ
jgi:hypothetical protein